jgi:hypothetical protein
MNVSIIHFKKSSTALTFTFLIFCIILISKCHGKEDEFDLYETNVNKYQPRIKIFSVNDLHLLMKKDSLLKKKKVNLVNSSQKNLVKNYLNKLKKIYVISSRAR